MARWKPSSQKLASRIQTCRGKRIYAYVVPEQHGVEELNHAYYDEKGHEGIEEKGSRGGVLEVVVPDVEGDLLGGGFG